jgi:hypothetical protein
MEVLLLLLNVFLLIALPLVSIYVIMDIAEEYMSVMEQLNTVSAEIALRVHKATTHLTSSTIHTLFALEQRLLEFRSLEPFDLKSFKILNGSKILTRVIKSFIFSKLCPPIRETPKMTTGTIQYVQCIPAPF